MSFIDQALALGFIALKNYYQNAGWFGATVYHPYFVLKRDNKEIIIDLTYFGCAVINRFYLNGKLVEENYKSVERTIKLTDNGKIIYESKAGEIPSDELMLNFLKK